MEIEHIDADALDAVQAELGVDVEPLPSTLRIIQVLACRVMEVPCGLIAWRPYLDYMGCVGFCNRMESVHRHTSHCDTLRGLNVNVEALPAMLSWSGTALGLTAACPPACQKAMQSGLGEHPREH